MSAKQPRELLGNRNVIFDLSVTRPYFDADEFRRFVEMSARFGGTHINVGYLPFEYDWFMPSNEDPYPAWAARSMGLFRLFTPPALEEWIPPERSKQLQDLMAQKFTILREFGMKGVVTNCIEPCWLPEGVFRAHPNWRGTQCELGRIAAKPYWTPNIDDPEVLEMYSWSMEQFCTTFPELFEITFLTNDSGGGVQWTANTYPGINGPIKYRGKGAGARVGGWLKALRDGAKRAGVRMRFHMHGGCFTPSEREAIWCNLDEDTFVSGRGGANGTPGGAGGAHMGGSFWTGSWPGVGISSIRSFMGGLQTVYTKKDDKEDYAQIGMDNWCQPMAEYLIDSFLEAPGSGLVHQSEALVRAAGKLVGEEDAETLVKVWDMVDEAVTQTMSVHQRGIWNTIPWGSTCSRWLIRPLVPKPLELTEDETKYYTDFFFSVGSKEQNADLCYILGKPVFLGDCIVWSTRWTFVVAVRHLNSAIATLDGILSRAGDKAHAMVKLYRDRLAAYRCIIENARLTIMYQHALNIAHYPRYAPNAFDYDDNMQFDQRCLEMRKIAREDLDNTAALIELMENSDEPLVGMSDRPDGENVFQFGPELVSQLKKKMDIMLDHWHDYETMFPTAKEYEFEPDLSSRMLQRPLNTHMRDALEIRDHLNNI